MIKIKYCQNGATSQIDNEQPILFKFDETNQGELIEMLYEIINFFNPGSRYDKEKIKIKLEHGDKYICNDKECKICKGEE